MMTETQQMINDCINRQEKLGDWETGFIGSVDSQLDKGKSLSEKQLNKLTSIWEKVTEDG